VAEAVVIILAEEEDQVAIMAEEEGEGLTVAVETPKVKVEKNQWPQEQTMISMMIHLETTMMEI
jgi:hypothetical protein